MNISAVKRMTVSEFLAWAENQDKGHYELVRGEIVAMAPERVDHVRAKLAAANALRAAIRRAGVDCEAFVEGLAVVIDEETSYEPDALVNCGERLAGNSMVASNPVIVVEVLSPSTRRIDTNAKLADYFRVPAIAHYLILDLARRHALHYRKHENGTVTLRIAADGALSLDPPGLSVEVTEFFG
jgi:Uma2 family endonuclease